MKVFRGGISQKQLGLETENVRFYAHPEGVYDFRFRVSAAGGGTSAILLRLSLEDLAGVLDQVASAGGPARVLSAAAARSVEVLDEELRVCAEQIAETKQEVWL